MCCFTIDGVTLEVSAICHQFFGKWLSKLGSLILLSRRIFFFRDHLDTFETIWDFLVDTSVIFGTQVTLKLPISCYLTSKCLYFVLLD